MKNLLQKILKSNGMQIKRYPNDDIKRRMRLINHFEIDTLLDVGANIGYYGLESREHGYKGQIISFEPLEAAFQELNINAKKDENWTAYNYALGNSDASDFINVSENSVSSSVLNMLDTHFESAPESKFIRRQEITIKKLDSIFDQICKNSNKIMLKIDTQGFEKNVLDGALNSLSQISLLQLEMSIVPLYENEMTFKDMYSHLENFSFELYSIENGFSNPITGQLYQVDGIFVNRKWIENKKI